MPHVMKVYKVILPFTQQSGCYMLEGETQNNYKMITGLRRWPCSSNRTTIKGNSV
jgi:hypothetical protein